MSNKTTYGMSITKLKRHKETTGVQKIQEFFKTHKDMAFRMSEIEKIFKNKLTIFAVRGAIKKLYDTRILNKKQFLQNKTYYFWNKEREQRMKKLEKLKTPRKSDKPTKVSFIGTEITRKPKKITFTKKKTK